MLAQQGKAVRRAKPARAVPETPQHTPEPWLIATDNPFVVYAQHEHAGVCICVTHDYEIRKGVTFKPADLKQARANARVIACAPKLLAALKHAVQCIEYCRRNHKDVQRGDGIPAEFFWKQLIGEAEGPVG